LPPGESPKLYDALAAAAIAALPEPLAGPSLALQLRNMIIAKQHRSN
jgi:hypothetical protein